jgi:hypothetical protein
MNRRGFIGMALLTVALILIIITSTALFNFFFVLFRTGHSAEGISADYARLSSGIYYGVWLVDNSRPFPGNLNVDGVNVPVNYNAATHTLTAGPVDNRSINAHYENSVITSWD